MYEWEDSIVNFFDVVPSLHKYILINTYKSSLTNEVLI